MKKNSPFQYVLHAAVVVGMVVAGTKYINGDEFTRAIKQFNWLYAPFIMSLSLMYVGVKAWRFAYMLRELADTSRSMVMRSYFAAQACTLLPGGIAARAAILEQAGVPVTKSAAAIAISSMSDQIVLIGCSIVAALWFPSARQPVFFLLGGLAALSIILGIEASRTWLIHAVKKILGKWKLSGYVDKFLVSLREIATVPVLLAGIGNSLLAAIFMILALDLSLRGVGADVPYFRLLLAFTLPSLMGRISALPGGVGVIEAGMVGILDASPGIRLDQAAAAVAIFRVGTLLFAALVGGLVYWLGWHGAAEKKAAH